MKLTNIHGLSSIDQYVNYKIEKYSKAEKTFESLFECMFDESDNVMFETSDGYRINKVYYGEFKEKIIRSSPTLADMLSSIPQGEIIGLYMSNRPEWLQVFWEIILCGYRPLLMNTRLPDDVLDGILTQYSVKAVISDGKQFSGTTLDYSKVTVPSDNAPLNRVFGNEVIFMSSGTTEKIKLCAFSGENFYYQILDSANIIKQCPSIKKHYKGQIKQLMLLPLCHVFGFIAVYLWFGFFSRTFVFPKDLNPITIQQTVKKHEVTHIFAVPMVWESVYRAAMKKIRAKGEKTLSRFKSMCNRVNSHGKIGDFLARRFLGEVRDGLFGNSIQFLITGGSTIRPETLSFFNGIGYHLANGYGMTEIGITSLEKSSKRKMLNKASIGAPFGYTEYSLNEQGQLLVKGKTRASKIIVDGVESHTDPEKWFCTGDLMRCDDGRYYSEGRSDDLIISDDGENLNPIVAEMQIHTKGIDRLCIFRGADKVTTLVASIPGCFSCERLEEIYNSICEELTEAKLGASIKRILFTHESLLGEGEIKISRRKIANAVSSGAIKTFDPTAADRHIEELLLGLEAEIRDCFAEALEKKPESIGAEDHFFRDLGGTSLDYFSLISIIRSRFGFDISYGDGANLSTVKEFSDYLKDK